MSLDRFEPALRGLIAQIVTLPPSFSSWQWAAGRLYGGFVLAFHDLPAPHFRQQIDALRPNQPVHLSVIIDRLKAGKSTCGLFAITVDDGVGQTVRAIAAVAAERHWPVTFFLPTGYLDHPGGMPFQHLRNVLSHLPPRLIEIAGERIDASSAASLFAFEARWNRVRDHGPRDEYVQRIDELVQAAVSAGWLSRDDIVPPPPIAWEEVAALSRRPEIRFESHGVTHTAVSALSPDQLDAELRDSARRITLHTNRPCRHFCYPFGSLESIGSTAPRAVARHYDSAVTMSRGRLHHRSLFLLPRIPLYTEDTRAVARLKILTR